MPLQGDLDFGTRWNASTHLPSSFSTDAVFAKDLRLAFESLIPNAYHLTCPQPPDSNDRADEEGVVDWVLNLSLGQLQEIEEAIVYFERQSVPLNKIHPRYFPLPTLGPRLRERCMLLHKDKPFFLIRGMGPQWYSKWKNVIAFLGIASYVGTHRACTKGDPTVLHHITNLKTRPGEGREATYRGPPNRPIAIPFHNDYGEIVALYTLSRPANGGDFLISDIHDIATRIERVRPDLLQVLRNPYTMSNPEADCGYEERPLLFDTPTNGLVIQASRSRLFNDFSPTPSNIKDLSKTQIEALDALDTAGQEVAQRISFRSGDMIFFNNLKTMHARDAYVDGDPRQNTTARYLLRLILKDERNPAWEVPDELRETWRGLYDHDKDEEFISVHPRLVSLRATH